MSARCQYATATLLLTCHVGKKVSPTCFADLNTKNFKTTANCHKRLSTNVSAVTDIPTGDWMKSSQTAHKIDHNLYAAVASKNLTFLERYNLYSLLYYATQINEMHPFQIYILIF